MLTILFDVLLYKNLTNKVINYKYDIVLDSIFFYLYF